MDQPLEGGQEPQPHLPITNLVPSYILLLFLLQVRQEC
jgi:hypothetical protein